jgi:hypothetical protein
MGYCHGTPEELCAYVDDLDMNVFVPFRLKVWSSKVDKKRGHKPVHDQPFVWIMMPSRHSGAPAPSPATPPPATRSEPMASTPLPLSDIQASAKAHATVEVLQAEIERLNADIEALEKEVEETDAQAMQNATPAPLPWYQTEQGGKEIMAAVKPLITDISAALRGWMFKGTPRPPGSNAPAPQPAELGEGPTAQELELIMHSRGFKAAAPDEATGYETVLRENYGKASTPATNEQA